MKLRLTRHSQWLIIGLCFFGGGCNSGKVQSLEKMVAELKAELEETKALAEQAAMAERVAAQAAQEAMKQEQMARLRAEEQKILAEHARMESEVALQVQKKATEQARQVAELKEKELQSASGKAAAESK